MVRLRNDVTTVDEASTAVVEQVFPAFAQELGISQAEFEQRLRTSHPEAASAFLDQRDAIFASIDTTVSNLEAHQDDYDAADAIPTSFIPLSVMPWFALAFGLLLIGLGVWAWVQPGRASAAVVALAGAILITFTLVAQLPSKGAQAEDLLDSLNIDEEIATRTRTEFETFRAGTEDLKEVFVEFAESQRADAGRARRDDPPRPPDRRGGRRGHRRCSTASRARWPSARSTSTSSRR